MKFQDQICLEKIYWGQNYENNSWIQNQHPWKPVFVQYHLKESIFEFQDQNLPKEGVLGTELKKKMSNLESTTLNNF